MLLNIIQLWMIYMYACFLLTEKWMNLDDSVSYPKVGVHIYIYHLDNSEHACKSSKSGCFV